MVNKTETLAKLWIHETCRVFHDRLIDENDRNWFLDTLMKSTFVWFKCDWSKALIFDGELPLLFGDYLDKNIEISERLY